jgi:PAS domain S-box-containing protein
MRLMPFHSQRVQSKASITKLLSVLGAFFASVFAIAIPSIYFASSINAVQQTLTIEAAFLTRSIENIIHDRPDMWEFESVRLKEIISKHLIREAALEGEIRTAAGKLVEKSDFTEARPIISVSAPFFDSGRLAGSIIIRHSIRTQIITTALLGILSSFFASLLYYIFRTYPIRTLENTLTELQRACLTSLVLFREQGILEGSIIDITERKQAEKALCESQNIIEGIVNAIPVRVFWKDKNLVYLGCNALFANDAGFADPKDIIGKDDYQMGWRDQAELYRGDDRQVIESGSSKFLIEEPQTTPEGNTITLLTSKIPLRSSTGEISGVLGTYMDITERKRLEEELLRVQKLESVGILAGGIAHDFNNILTTILGNVFLAKSQVTPEDEMFDLLSESETALARAQTLTRQLLTFAKGGVPVKEVATIKDILKESSLFVLRGSKSGCEFSIEEDLWLTEVDVGQISQVFNNIMINANQSMPEGGIIQVVAKNYVIEGKPRLPVKPGRHVKISITDQGVGISEKHLLNIFDPYFTTKQEGSGLGLATTYSIIKKHDGHITVESQLGVGTIFHIYLPASEKAVLQKEETRLIKGRGRILVMDDEAPLRKMVGRMLKILGYEPEFAKNGAEAIRMVKEAIEAEKPYDAVILDLTIPGGMGGKDAVKKLLEISPEVKAIVSSGYSDDPVLSNFQECGFKGVMPKPFEFLSLSKVLHEVLKGKGKN